MFVYSVPGTANLFSFFVCSSHGGRAGPVQLFLAAPGRLANHVPKTLHTRVLLACRAGGAGTRSYGGAMPIGPW